MVKYLGDFEQRIRLDHLHDRQKQQMSTWCNGDEPITTYNILLEYAEMDLEEYFRNFHPPFLPNEVRGFWQELINVVAALEKIHDWKPPGGRGNVKG